MSRRRLAARAAAALPTVAGLLWALCPVTAAAAPPNVQCGTASFAGTTATGTLSAVVLDQSFLVFSARIDENTPDSGTISGQITNTTTVTFERYTAGNSVTVEWCVAEFATGVFVQRGALDPATPTTVVALGTAVDPTKSFPLVSFRALGTNVNHDDFMQAKIINGGADLELSFDGIDTPEGEVVEWQVVEYTNANVQTGDVAFATGDASRTAPVTQIDTTKSWLIHSFQTQNGTVANIGQKLVRGVITGDTTLTFDRDQTGQTIDLTWYLVEFTDSTTVQHGSEAFGTTDTQGTAALTSVDTSATIALAGNFGRGGKSPFSTDDNPGPGWFTLDVTGPTTLDIQRSITGSAAADVGWFVVEFDTASIPTPARRVIIIE